MKRLSVIALVVVMFTAAMASGSVQNFQKFTLDIPSGWKAEIVDDVIEIIVEVTKNDKSSSMTVIYGAIGNDDTVGNLSLDEDIKNWLELYENPSKIEHTPDGCYTFTHTTEDGKRATLYAREFRVNGRAMYANADMTGSDMGTMKTIFDSFTLTKAKDTEEDDDSDDEARDENGNTQLILAAYRGKAGAVRDLLQAGANVNIRNKWGMSALMYAAEGNHAEAVKVLLEAGADIDAANNEGSTALMIAMIHGCRNAATLLLDAGADVKVRNNDGKRAIDFARKNEKLKGSHVIKRLEQLSR